MFPGDFDRPAAAWRFENEKDAVAPLRALLERGLLLFDGDVKRYRLHDLMRPLARDVFSTAPDKDPPPDSAQRIEQAMEKFALHYLIARNAAKSLFETGNEGVLGGLSLYDRESTNVDLAAEWAIEQQARSRAAQYVATYLPNAGAYILDLRLSSRRRIHLLESALTGARSLGHREAEGVYLGNLGNAYADLGETRRAIDHYEQALLISREVGDRHNEGNQIGNLGNAYAFLGKTQRAIDHCEQALVIAREIGDRRGEGNSLGNLGLAYAALGETQRATLYLEKALAIFEAIESPYAERVRQALDTLRGEAGTE